MNAFAESLFKVTILTVNGDVECVGGSYNGVPFFVEEVASNGGRNVATTSLPFSANHVNEDLGQKLKQYPIKFYLVGTDANSQREKLEEAFNAEGAFELVHPYFGKFNARCIGYNISISLGELEYISGDATFVSECDVKAVAIALTDYRSLANASADSSESKALAAFKAVCKLANKAKSFVDSILDLTNDVLDDIETARSSMRSVSKFMSELSQIRDNISTIIATPSDFAARLDNLCTMTGETLKTDGGFNDYVNESLTLMENVEIDDGTLAIDEQSANIQRLVLMATAANIVRCAVRSTFESAEQVHVMQSRISDVFEYVMERINDMECYQSLSEMLGYVTKYLQDVVANLAQIVDLPLLQTRDALSLCFDCYGSLDKLDAVLDRNSVSDPMVINRKNLKVLSK